MGYLSTNIGVIVGAGGDRVPSVRSNAGVLNTPLNTFAHFSITGESIDVLVTLAGSDVSCVNWIDALIGELATLRGALLRRAAGTPLRAVVAPDIEALLAKAPPCANCGEPALDHDNATAECPGTEHPGVYVPVDNRVVAAIEADEATIP